MKVKCMNCGLILEKCLSLQCICPECGCCNWGLLPKEETTMLELAKEFLRVVKEEIKVVKKESVPDKEYLKRAEKEMDRIDPFHYRKECKKEELMFEIFEYFNGKKTQVRKIYLNGHIEGFKGDPCIVNHILPKILALKALLGQINKDYRDLIEAYTIRGLPLDQVPLHELYIREMEGIENIKI